MTVKLPQKAGFAPTVQEWDQLVRIAENLAAQLAQAQDERDAAREHAERQQLSKDGLYRELREMSSQRDAERAAARAALENERELRKYYQGNSDVDNPLSYALAVGQLAAARTEVARLTERANKSARALELWAHDADQFSQRTADGQALISDDDLTAVKTIAAALRQPAPAPATKE